MHFRYDREERGRVRDILRLEYARDALVDEFVETSSREDERVAELFRCVQLLHYVCGILATGTDKPMKYMSTLEALITELRAKYVELFASINPKLHHMHHILDATEWAGKEAQISKRRLDTWNIRTSSIS